MKLNILLYINIQFTELFSMSERDKKIHLDITKLKLIIKEKENAPTKSHRQISTDVLLKHGIKVSRS